MTDSPSNPEAQAETHLTITGTHDKFLEALNNFSLTNWETTLPSLDQYRSDIPPFLPLPFLPHQSTAKSKDEATNIHHRFALSAKPDYFIIADFWSKLDQNKIFKAEKHHSHIIQRLEYRNIEYNQNSDGLPQYIFQLGRLILPIDELVYAYKLPFVAVVDVLDPCKAVWLVHVEEMAEDAEEGRDWYPPRYVLDQFSCLFGDSKRREPVYHVARIASSLEEWMVMDNIKRSRCRGVLEIKVAWQADFKLAVDEARSRRML